MIRLVLILLFTCSFTLATWLEPAFDAMKARHSSGTGPLAMLLGDSRRLFANQFFAMADVYYHSGYYPTIFDAKPNQKQQQLDVASHEGDEGTTGKMPPADLDDNFMGRPKDWIEKMGRNFEPTVHTHLQGMNAREILPWLKLSAEMDPNQIDTYVTAAYWLRTRLHQPVEAEEFLRDGLKANPDSYEILLELGRVEFYERNLPLVARNIWDVALAKWNKQDKAGANPDPHDRQEILGEMIREDRKIGDLRQEVNDLERLRSVVTHSDELERQIEQAKAKIAAGSKQTGTNAPNH